MIITQLTFVRQYILWFYSFPTVFTGSYYFPNSTIDFIVKFIPRIRTASTMSHGKYEISEKKKHLNVNLT